MTETKKQRKGFACLSDLQRRAIARLGGQAAHKKGTAHRWTSEEAREAGRRGGVAADAKRKAKKAAQQQEGAAA